MARPPEKPGSGLKEAQVRALREARYDRWRPGKKGKKTEESEIEMLRSEVKRLKLELAQANRLRLKVEALWKKVKHG